MNDDEIWFEKWLWSYMPCNLKGVAFLFVLVVAALSCVFGLRWLFDEIGRPDLEQLAYLSLFPVIIWGWLISERHSRPRSQ